MVKDTHKRNTQDALRGDNNLIAADDFSCTIILEMPASRLHRGLSDGILSKKRAQI
jgi:hypothetical protein